MNRISTTFVGMLFTSAALWAQTSQINGIVKDSTGLAIPGAEVKATQTATGLVRVTTSGNDGGYVLTNLPVGPYLLEATKQGFNKYAQTGIVLQVDTAPTIDISMQVGSVSDQVTVEASTVQVETRNTSIGQVVDNQRIMELPLNGRDVHQLIFLAGMANYPGQAGLQTVRNYPTVVVTVAGGAPDAVTYNLDGIIHQDPYNNLSLPLPFPDAVQEFKVEWNSVPPQYGYHSTANVNAVTKSGTNQFHGDLFEFLRNGDLNARDAFATKRDTLKRNQFGGTVGGPVLRDRLFFFGGYQRTTLRSDPSQNTAFIPTAATVTGDFTALAACNKVTLLPSAGFNNNQIAPSLISPVAVNILKTMPVSNDPCGRTVYGLVANQDEDLYTAKVDYQYSAKHSFFGRFTSAKLNQGSTFDGKNPLSINQYGINDLDFGVALGHTWVVNPNLVSSFRVGANRTNIVKVADDYGSWGSFGANVSPLGGNVIAISTNNSAFAIGGPSASPGQSHNGPLWSVVEDISWIKGSHQIGFGGGIYRQMLNYWSGVNAVGTATFDGSVSGLPLADFMLGRPSTFNQGTIYGFYSRQFYGSLYIQDSWKISRNLTVNYGVRWEPYTAVYQKYTGQDEHFDFGLFAQNVHSTIYKNSPAGVVFSGDPQYGCGDYFNCPKWNKFFPRAGLAWDPKGDGKMVVRAAYGMFGDRMSMLSLSQEQFGPPFGNLVSAAGTNLTNPWATYGGLTGFTQPGQNPMPTLASLQGLGHSASSIPFPQFGTFVTSPLNDFHPTYVNQWNLSIQRELGRDWLVSANYLGTSTIHFASGANINPAVFIPGNCAAGQYGLKAAGACSTTANQNFRRVLYLQNPDQGQYYAGIGLLDDGGTGSYEGLNLSAQKRLSHGVNVLTNYTWSHCISDAWNQNPTANGVSIPDARRQWRGNCQGLDLRQLFQLSMVATTPRYSNRALRILASDWQFAPNLEIKSAQFFSVIAGSDRALTTVASPAPGQPASLVNTNPYPTNQSPSQWLSRSAFDFPALGTYGNLGWNNLKGPGVFQLNLALSRNFPIMERRTLQVRAEAFNLPNHLNPFTPGNAPTGAANFGGIAPLNAPNFGQITNDISGNGLAAGDYRIIQLAMKFIF